MTDNGLAALAAAMELHFRPPDAPPGGSYTMETYRRDAAAILGERGVFLPDGLPDYNIAYAAGVEDGKGEQAAEIATLRAALDAHHRGLTLAGDGPDKCAICAALAAAKEATDGGATEPDPNRKGMPKCPRCGDIAIRPDPVDWRKPAWRCGGCHRVLGRCNCDAAAKETP
jgi:hypothetical protein